MTAAVIGFLLGADRFEDVYGPLGISLDDFIEQPSVTWPFNLVAALREADVETVLFFMSAQVEDTVRARHRATGTLICVLPSPLLHRKAQGFRDRLLPGRPAMRSVLAYLALPMRRFAVELRRYGCQAILCQEYESGRFDRALLVGRVLRLPVLATYQGASRGYSRVEALTRPAALRACAGLIIPAEDEADRVAAKYHLPACKVARIPNAVDVAHWTPGDRREARARTGLPQDAAIVAWHGRVQIEVKGLDVLLDAWSAVCRTRQRRALLLLVGSGNDAPELGARLATSGPAEVRWVDRYVTDPAELVTYLSAADISVLPSRREGFAVAVLEGMACGLPVVATAVNGAREALVEGGEAGGVIVPPGDSAALADALGALLDDPCMAREMGRIARERAVTRFSTPVVGARLRAFMERRGALPHGA